MIFDIVILHVNSKSNTYSFNMVQTLNYFNEINAYFYLLKNPIILPIKSKFSCPGKHTLRY